VAITLRVSSRDATVILDLRSILFDPAAIELGRFQPRASRLGLWHAASCGLIEGIEPAVKDRIANNRPVTVKPGQLYEHDNVLYHSLLGLASLKWVLWEMGVSVEFAAW
jgi:hypothetical protein